MKTQINSKQLEKFTKEIIKQPEAIKGGPITTTRGTIDKTWL